MSSCFSRGRLPPRPGRWRRPGTRRRRYRGSRATNAHSAFDSNAFFHEAVHDARAVLIVADRTDKACLGFQPGNGNGGIGRAAARRVIMRTLLLRCSSGLGGAPAETMLATMAEAEAPEQIKDSQTMPSHW